MKKRWIFIPVVGLFIVTLILGSFFDLQINQAIYDRYNGFGLFMSAFGESPVYAFMGTIGFGYFWLTKHYKKVWQRIILIVLFIAAIGICTYYQGHHIFCVNAYITESKTLKLLGYGIGLLFALLGALAGYFLFKNSQLQPKQLLYILVFLTLVIAVAVGINQLAKIFMSRPRFRFLADNDVIASSFKNWWDMSGRSVRDSWVGKEDTISGAIITKEEFKSFPSGHMTNTTAIIAIMAMLPVINEHIKVKQEIMLVIGLVWALILGFSRMLVGAHFLSDVSMGALLTVVVFYALNEIFLHFYNKLEEPLPANEQPEVNKQEE